MLLKHGRIGNIGSIGNIGVHFEWITLRSTYTQLICLHLPKIIRFYIINIFKSMTTGCLLAIILLPLCNVKGFALGQDFSIEDNVKIYKGLDRLGHPGYL